MQRNRNAAIDRLLHFIKDFKVSGRSFDSFAIEDGGDFVEIRNRKVGSRTRKLTQNSRTWQGRVRSCAALLAVYKSVLPLYPSAVRGGNAPSCFR